MKRLIQNWTFDASAQTITFLDFVQIDSFNVLLITNTDDNIIIYNFADPTLGGTVFSTNVLTLDYDTTAMDDGDYLQIWYWDNTAEQAVSLTSTTITGTVTVGSHAVTNAGTFLVQNNAATPAGTNNIGDVDVLTLPAIPAGTNNIGDVDVLTLPALVAGTALIGKVGIDQTTPGTTNAVAVTNTTFPVTDNAGSLTVDAPVGTPVFVKLSDGAAPITTLPVSLASVPSHAVTNIGTFAVQVDGAALTSLQLADNVVVVLGTDTYTEATSSGTAIGAVRRDADTTLVNTTNEWGPLQMDANGRLKVEAFSGETLPVSMTSTTITGSVAVTQSGTWDEIGINDSGNSITVDAPVGTPAFVRLSDGAAAITTLAVSLASVPSHAVTNIGTFAVQVDGAALTSLQLIDDTIVVLGTDTYTETTSKGVANGAVRRDADTTLVNTTNEWGPLQMDARGFLKVEAFSGEVLPVSDNAGSITVDAPTGTPVAVQIGNATLTAGVIDETGASAVDALAVGGGTAHDAVDSGNPQKIGGKARTTNPTAVADGDRVDASFDVLGKQVVVLNAPKELKVDQTTTITASTAETTVLTAGAAGVKHSVTAIFVANTSATPARVDFRDDTAGTIRFALQCAAGVTTGFALGGDSMDQTTAAKNWTAQSSASVTDLRIYVKAFKVV